MSLVRSVPVRPDRLMTIMKRKSSYVRSSPEGGRSSRSKAVRLGGHGPVVASGVLVGGVMLGAWALLVGGKGDADRASLSGLASADKWEAKSANVGSAQGLEVDMRSPAGTETSEVVLEREAPSHEAEEEPASLPEPIPSLRDTKAHAEELLGWVKLDHENAREANTELWRIGMAIIQDADARGVARLHNVSAGLMNRPSFVEVWGDEIAWWSNEDGQPRTLLTAPVKKSLCTGDTEHAG